MSSELCARSCFSFLVGSAQPATLIERALELGYTDIAITDDCSVAGSVRAFEAGKDQPIKLIHGAQFTTTEGHRLTALVRDALGWPSLCSTISLARRQAPKGRYHIRLDQLPDDPHLAWIAMPATGADLATAIPPLQAHFERLYLAAVDHKTDRCGQHMAALDRFAFSSGLTVIATSDACMARRSEKPIQDLVTAIRLNRPLDALGDALAPNAEACLRTPDELTALYPAAWRANARTLAAACNFNLDQLQYRYPSELVPPSYANAGTYLRALVEQGAKKRWPGGTSGHVRGLIEKELGLIHQLGYEPYFLTVQDVVQFARDQGILCQGRGSAANSVVCYCLFITEVDPARVAVLFERFISADRNEPPDIDVDFEHHRREEVIQYLYTRYGRERAAIAATVITYRPKSAIRDVGRALGMDEGLLKRLSKSLSWWSKPEDMRGYFADNGIDDSSPRFQLFLKLAIAIQGLPRHLSQHVGGFVISDGPLSQWVPVENAAMADRTLIQWDKDDIETLGLLKLDVLALGMLSAIRRTLDGIRQWRRQDPAYVPALPDTFSLQDIPADDAATYDALCQGDSLGVFQVESRAQMSMLPRLKPRNYYDLVIQIAIVRPGPIQGDMVHPYLRRRDGSEAFDYPNDEVRAVLERTLGVPIFQEQVIQLTVVAAGFTPSQADNVRRSMAAWKRRGGLEHLEARIKDGMRTRGYPDEFADRVYQQILGFGNYGFPESHAASFALLVYVSAWLKRHAPEAFYAGLLNSYPMGFYSPSQILQDARRHGIAVLPVDINASDYDYSVQLHDGKAALRVGLRAIKKLNESTLVDLLTERHSGPFRDMADLAARSRLSGAVLERLAAAGALDGLAGHRQAARWALADSLWQLPLLAEAGWFDPSSPLPAAPQGSQIVEDFRATGFSLRTHPIALLRTRHEAKGCITLDQLKADSLIERASVIGLVTGRQRPGTAGGVMFATLEDETGNHNLILWPSLVDRYRQIILTSRLWRVCGEVQRKHGVIHLIVDQVINLDYLLGALPMRAVSYRP
ncbi:DNA polymerase III subunit alpha [Litorivicinus lipolyticus]|uniref:Error-prone DNA polymerase n=1 Tax=Litorivicinus lipolyticus TaxID=418701 RepID=A0A5Q2Q8Y2_9GAMM|nr:error-prone DNA polymerase [Litorivicinus lipolyticus]QGG79334.1 DNA polymerase III subunit alpha [Litorivicinus lipolyticus]